MADTPVASERLSGTHQLAIAQAYARSSVWAPMPAGAIGTPAALVVRHFIVPAQIPEPRYAWFKSPQIDAGPFLSVTVENQPQVPPQWTSVLFHQPPASQAAVTSIIRPIASAPQANPAPPKQWVFGQVPPTALTPPIRSFRSAPQTDPTQIPARFFSAPPAPVVVLPRITFILAAPQLIDLTLQPHLWGPWPVVAPPIRPFSAGPQRIDLTQQPVWMRQPPPTTLPTPPPNRPFKAGPLISETAQVSRGYSYVWGAPPPVPAILEVVPYLIEDSLSAALMRIASIYCVASVTGTTGSVTAQSPDAFTLVPRGTTIFITLGGAVHTGGGGRSRAQSPYGTPDAIPPWSLTRKH